MSIAARHTGGKQMAMTTSATQAKHEAELRAAEVGLAKAIAADKPAHIIAYWKQKVTACRYLAGVDA